MNNFFYLLIAGSRTFNDYNYLCNCLDKLLVNIRASGHKIVVISGMAKGADALGLKYGIEKCYDVVRCPASWDKYGKRSGYVRNEIMGDLCSAAVIFWDGKSSGSKHMLDICKRLNKDVRVYYFTN